MLLPTPWLSSNCMTLRIRERISGLSCENRAAVGGQRARGTEGSQRPQRPEKTEGPQLIPTSRSNPPIWTVSVIGGEGSLGRQDSQTGPSQPNRQSGKARPRHATPDRQDPPQVPQATAATADTGLPHHATMPLLPASLPTLPRRYPSTREDHQQPGCARWSTTWACMYGISLPACQLCPSTHK